MKIIKKLAIFFGILIITMGLLWLIIPFFFCVKSGQKVTSPVAVLLRLKCCDSLVPKTDSRFFKFEQSNSGMWANTPSNSGCAYPMCECEICLPCGNNVCDEKEDACNCPEDCKKE